MIEKLISRKLFESDLYKWWMKQGYFTPKAESDKPYFFNGYAAAQYYRSVALGTRSG